MIDYNRRLSNERETQVPSPRISTLVLLETLIFIEIVSVSVMLFYVQYQIPQLVLTANSNSHWHFKPFIHLWIFPSGLKQ